METYSAWEWIRRRTGGMIGEGLQYAADMVPLGQALRFRFLGGLKGGSKGLSILFPEKPKFVQLGVLPRSFGRAIDVIEEILTAGGPTATAHAVDQAIYDAIVLFFGQPGLGGVLVAPSYYGADP